MALEPGDEGGTDLSYADDRTPFPKCTRPRHLIGCRCTPGVGPTLRDGASTTRWAANRRSHRCGRDHCCYGAVPPIYRIDTWVQRTAFLDGIIRKASHSTSSSASLASFVTTRFRLLSPSFLPPTLAKIGRCGFPVIAVQRMPRVSVESFTSFSFIRSSWVPFRSPLPDMFIACCFGLINVPRHYIDTNHPWSVHGPFTNVVDTNTTSSNRAEPVDFGGIRFLDCRKCTSLNMPIDYASTTSEGSA